MLNYLKVSGAPAQLVQMAEKYKLQLWRMKDGVLTSKHLRELPLTLQMELIFDINVAHFHNTLLFRDASKKLLLIFKKLKSEKAGSDIRAPYAGSFKFIIFVIWARRFQG